MARWLIEINGEPFDLEEYPTGFPDGDVFAIRQVERFYLTGPRFDRAGSVEAVRDEANAVLRELFGVIRLLRPAARLPKLGHVQYEHDDGRRDQYIALEGVEVRIKAGSVGLSGAGDTQIQQTQAQTFHSTAMSSPHLKDAVQLLSYPPHWGTLYRILENIEKHLGRDVDEAGLTTRAERDRFTRTANVPEAGGVTARHASKGHTPPPNPMTLDEGYRLVRRVFDIALRKT